MKQWIKIETDIMYHHGVRRMYAAHRQYGLATYIMLRLHIEALSDSGIPYQEAVSYGTSYASKSIVEKIINDYGLFTITDDNIVMPLQLSDSLADTHVDDHVDASVDDHVDTNVDDQVGSHKPTKDENRKEKSKKKSTLSDEEKTWQKEFAEHYPYLARIKEPLTLAQYNKLLERYPNNRIIEKLERMDNMPDFTKKYRCLYRTLLNWLKS